MRGRPATWHKEKSISSAYVYTYKWKYQIILLCFRRRVDARVFIAGYKSNFIKRSDLHRNLKDTRQHYGSKIT